MHIILAEKKRDDFEFKEEDYDNEAIARRLQMEYDEKLAREMYIILLIIL